jgi:hypothetical protein
MGKFREFLRSVFSHWEPVMSGVLAALFLWVIGWLYEQRQGSNLLPWYAHVFVALAFLFYACYRTWLDQGQKYEQEIQTLKETQRQIEDALRQQITDLKAQLDRDTARRSQQEALVCFSRRGNLIRKDYEVPDDVSAVPAKKWAEELFSYLEENVGPIPAHRFASDEGIPPFYLPRTDVSQQNKKVHQFLSNRLRRLDEIMKDLRN